MDIFGFAATLKVMGAIETETGWKLPPYRIKLKIYKHDYGGITLIELYKEKKFIDLYKQTYMDFEKIMYIISK